MTKMAGAEAHHLTQGGAQQMAASPCPSKVISKFTILIIGLQALGMEETSEESLQQHPRKCAPTPGDGGLGVSKGV